MDKTLSRICWYAVSSAFANGSGEAAGYPDQTSQPSGYEPRRQSDDIGDCVDYSALAKKVQAHAETSARFTVEALANDLQGYVWSKRGYKK